ncbi:3-deoxy-manno-octulosonate cytidylyltransferase [Thiorhodospira sibirica]|uniref:3-deoxy-manno-octulosonate cytidylyltransferase n=1 Tax=Thiorhodospira sibirica TaxID=154347 RepID=UPI00022C2E12|nr:3-deoxy-manno-octulosonate cytidylyltransferase [Thiorhodospira sibirica]
MSFKIVIPARYASSRLPGKPLIELAGKTLLAHVYQQAQRCGADEVIIATEDVRIAEHAKLLGAVVCMTEASHASGTDRVAEVAQYYAWDEATVVVNLQGDEPLMPPEAVRQVAQALLTHTQADMATLCTPLHSTAQWHDPNVVKVVRDAHDYALYFSRAPIPCARDSQSLEPDGLPVGALRHIGLYAYRVGYLTRFSALPACALETIECLEQLRALHDGARIYIPNACAIPGPGVDVPADIDRVRAILTSA